MARQKDPDRKVPANLRLRPSTVKAIHATRGTQSFQGWVDEAIDARLTLTGGRTVRTVDLEDQAERPAPRPAEPTVNLLVNQRTQQPSRVRRDVPAFHKQSR